ncbi:hypothetical protein NQZ68_024507 [Dissostichus eleginoides]|nr:hypothetical protein NQZ68_024507 [Dissostichus eleginoides]
MHSGYRGTPIVLIISGGEDKRKKGANRNKKGRGSERRDGAPLPDSGCLDGKRVRGKRRRESTQHRGFLPQIVTKRGALYCYVFRIMKASGQQLPVKPNFSAWEY